MYPLVELDLLIQKRFAAIEIRFNRMHACMMNMSCEYSNTWLDHFIPFSEVHETGNVD